MIAKDLEIIATLGPSVSDKIQELILAGATAFRLNCSHLSYDQLSHWLEDLDNAFGVTQKILPVWLDLQGSKLRIGNLEKPMSIKKNDLVTFENCKNQTGDAIPLPHDVIFKSIRVFDKIFLDDGKLIFIVDDVEEDSFQAKAISDGQLTSYKGFTKENYQEKLVELSPEDISFIELTRERQNIGYAISYIVSTSEIELIRKYTNDRPIAGKVERLKAFRNLKELVNHVDTMWLCRGDLGVESNIYNLFHFEKVFTRYLRDTDKPYLIAGQVIQNMVKSNHPSRSEVTHLSYLLENGYNGVILSDETAIGNFPLKAVEFCRHFFDYLSECNK